MKTFFLPVFAVVSPVFAGFHSWAPPGPKDVRAPCPMLNTLANHGFLPHHGKDLTREITENALFDALNINKTAGSFLFDFALTTNPTPNATTFSLNDLGNHNILEHDASLSRTDAYFGNALVFNQTVFDETRSYWTGKTITMEMVAKARLARLKTSQATNPTFQMSDLGAAFSLGESVAYLFILGNKHTKTADRSRVEFFFENERLPLHLGWRRAAESFQIEDLNSGMAELQNITQALEEKTTPSPRWQRRNSHFSW